MVSVRRHARRSEEYERRRELWESQKSARQFSDAERYRRAIVGFDTYGKPLAEGDVPSEDIAWTDIAIGLERALNATGDPIFSDALACLKSYELHKGRPQASYRAAWRSVFGDDDFGYIDNMRWLLENRPHQIKSERSAAEDVAAHYFYRAETFDAAVQALRKKFARWKRDGFPPQQSRYDLGEAGYSIRVRPAAATIKVPLPGRNPSEFLDQEGLIVPFTEYWRSRFHDGDVWICKAP